MSTASVAGRATVLDLAPRFVANNETGVDLLPYEGSMICVDAEAGGSITYAVNSDSADNSSFTDLSGAAFSHHSKHCTG